MTANAQNDTVHPVRSGTRRGIPGILGILGVTGILGAVGILGNLPASGAATRAVAYRSETATYHWGVAETDGWTGGHERIVPTRVPGISGSVVQIATSNSDSYALTRSGRVYAWGLNRSGELGSATTIPYSTQAVRVAFPASVRIVSLPNPMPFDGALAIDSTGHLWGWGLNPAGDLCIAGRTHFRPARLPFSHVTLATGARAHILVAQGDRVLACGSGHSGDLGNGSMASARRPTAVARLPHHVRVRALTSSWGGSGALFANGAYYNWGFNRSGQLGDGTRKRATVPVRVHLPSAVVSVFQGGSGPANGQTVAILANHSVWAWGNNRAGQLGDGTRVGSDVPVRVRVPAGVRFVAVSSGGRASYAIDSRGRLWAWGGGQNGQLGTGIRTPSETVPVQVGIRATQVSSTASNVAAVGRTT